MFRTYSCVYIEVVDIGEGAINQLPKNSVNAFSYNFGFDLLIGLEHCH